MNKITEKAFEMIVYFRYFVLVFAIVLIGLPWVPLFAQRQPRQSTMDRFELNEVGDRVERLEALNIERRITVLETIEQENKDDTWWHRGSSVGTGLLLVEAVVRTARNKKKSQEQ